MPNYTDRLATPRQVEFATSLLKARLKTLGLASLEEASNALGLTSPSLQMSTVSTLIDRLKAMPEDPDETMPDVVAAAHRKGKGNRPGRCTGCGHTVGQGDGWYYMLPSGAWAVHHVRGGCLAEPAPAPVELTEGVYVAADGTVVKVYRTRNARLAGKVKVGRSFRYQAGAAALAATGHLMTAEEAAAFGKTHGYCVNCAHDLTDDRSVTVGYGPVCAKNNGWPWG